MAICFISGCEHRIKHNPSRKSHYSSWRLFHICPCCAKEIFPFGFIPPRGITIRFCMSSNCIALIHQEQENVLLIQRRNNVSKEN